MNTTRSRLALLGLAVGAVVAGIAVASAVRDNDRGAGSPPEIDVAQDASADSQGIKLSATGAAFSGTGTFIQLAASVTSETPPVQVRVRPQFLAQRSVGLPPGSPGVGFGVGQPAVVRFEALRTDEPPFLGLTALELHYADGSTAIVSGDWRLDLATPADLQHRLRTEQLRAEPVSDGPMRVAVEGAIRSVSETLVTVRFDTTEALTQLGAPFLFSGGERLY